MKNVPDRIFINLGDYDEEYTEEDDFNELGEVTWCMDKIFPNDIEYVRKDALLEFLAGLEKDSARNAGTDDLACAAHDMVCLIIEKIESL